MFKRPHVRAVSPEVMARHQCSKIGPLRYREVDCCEPYTSPCGYWWMECWRSTQRCSQKAIVYPAHRCVLLSLTFDHGESILFKELSKARTSPFLPNGDLEKATLTIILGRSNLFCTLLPSLPGVLRIYCCARCVGVYLSQGDEGRGTT